MFSMYDFFKTQRKKFKGEIIKPKNFIIWTKNVEEYFFLGNFVFESPSIHKADATFKIYLGLTHTHELALFYFLPKDEVSSSEVKLVCFWMSMQVETNSTVLEWTHEPPRMGEGYLTDPRVIFQTKIRNSLIKRKGYKTMHTP